MKIFRKLTCLQLIFMCLLAAGNAVAQQKVIIDVRETKEGLVVTVDNPRVVLREKNRDVIFGIRTKGWVFDPEAGGIVFDEMNCQEEECEFSLEGKMSPRSSKLKFKNRFKTFDKEFYYAIHLINKEGNKAYLDPILINKRD